MDTQAKVTSKGQVTIPKSVRDALGLRKGDELLFRVLTDRGSEPSAIGTRAIIAKTPDFLDLAGSVTVPAGKRGVPWDEAVRRTRGKRAGRRH
jgi:antitoxin PrlF